ncbi:hypothetical protein C8F04DRAFT_1185710 [Mycena alexandri]|uniref:Ubiquitin-like protease family profile domain-containing protein n=1 Tax=Mycena alexandri TaxID=1745969 RepID=A0AAD6SPQ6_9AGAR|nr:hypothetical protein C8F04DRAFT_1185710 [Mycena alexandri]
MPGFRDPIEKDPAEIFSSLKIAKELYFAEEALDPSIAIGEGSGQFAKWLRSRWRLVVEASAVKETQTRQPRSQASFPLCLRVGTLGGGVAVADTVSELGNCGVTGAYSYVSQIITSLASNFLFANHRKRLVLERTRENNKWYLLLNASRYRSRSRPTSTGLCVPNSAPAKFAWLLRHPEGRNISGSSNPTFAILLWTWNRPGPKDPTRNPQFYDPSRPWLPFVEKDPGDEIDPDVAHVQVFKVWKTKDLDGSVGYLDYKFIELLKKMHAREDDRIRNFKRDLYRRNIHREIIDAGIYSTTETDFRSLLTIGYFDAAVDAVKRLQRLLLEKRAWCKLTAAYPYTNSQFNAPEEIRVQIARLTKESVQVADDELIGLWLNGNEIPPLHFWWFLKSARVPCFVIQEAGEEHKWIEPRTSTIAGTEIEQLMTCMPYDERAVLPACTLQLPERKAWYENESHAQAISQHRSSWHESPSYRLLNDVIVDVGLQFCMADLSAESPFLAERFFFFDTFFFTKLREVKKYAGVKKWFKKCKFSEKRFLVVPIHSQAKEWFLGTAQCSRPRQEVGVLLLLSCAQEATDWMPQAGPDVKPDPDVAALLRDCVKEAARDQNIMLPLDVVEKMVEVPQQNNSSDCGLFLLHFIRCIMRAPMHFISRFIDESEDCSWETQKIPFARENLMRRVSDLVDQYNKRPIEIDSDSDSESEPPVVDGGNRLVEGGNRAIELDSENEVEVTDSRGAEAESLRETAKSPLSDYTDMFDANENMPPPLNTMDDNSSNSDETSHTNSPSSPMNLNAHFTSPSHPVGPMRLGQSDSTCEEEPSIQVFITRDENNCPVGMMWEGASILPDEPIAEALDEPLSPQPGLPMEVDEDEVSLGPSSPRSDHGMDEDEKAMESNIPTPNLQPSAAVPTQGIPPSSTKSDLPSSHSCPRSDHGMDEDAEAMGDIPTPNLQLTAAVLTQGIPPSSTKSDLASSPYICPDCQERRVRRARQVANSVVPELDAETIHSLELRLYHENPWHLDEDSNVLRCWGCNPNSDYDLDHDSDPDAEMGKCAVSTRYLRHVKGAELGFISEQAYLDYKLKVEEAANPTLVITLRDDEDVELPDIGEAPLQPKDVGRKTGSDSLSDEARRDANLIEHMKQLRLLQGARGRLVMNKFMHEDPATRERITGVRVGLEGALRSKISQRDEMKAQLKELEATLDQLRREVVEGNQKLEDVDDERPRKYPDSYRRTDPHHAEPVNVNPLVHITSFRQTLGPTSPSESASSSGAGSTTICGDLSSAGLAKLSSGELTMLRRTLAKMTAPDYNQSPRLFARWLQVQKNTRIKGIPIQPPDFTVDERDVRGRNRVMSMLPPRGTSQEDRRRHNLCLCPILRVLARPYAYGTMLRQRGIQVAPGAGLSSTSEVWPAGTDEEATRFMASQGLTIDEANDSWQFCLNYLQAEAKTPSKGFDDNDLSTMLEEIHKEIGIRGQPPGFKPREQDQLRCFLPLMGKETKKSSDRGEAGRKSGDRGDPMENAAQHVRREMSTLPQHRWGRDEGKRGQIRSRSPSPPSGRDGTKGSGSGSSPPTPRHRTSTGERTQRPPRLDWADSDEFSRQPYTANWIPAYTFGGGGFRDGFRGRGSYRGLGRGRGRHCQPELDIFRRRPVNDHDFDQLAEFPAAGKLGNFGVRSEFPNTARTGSRFRTMEMSRGTQRIRGAETAADTSDFGGVHTPAEIRSVGLSFGVRETSRFGSDFHSPETQAETIEDMGRRIIINHMHVLAGKTHQNPKICSLHPANHGLEGTDKKYWYHKFAIVLLLMDAERVGVRNQFFSSEERRSIRKHVELFDIPYRRPTEDYLTQILYGDGVEGGSLRQCRTLVKSVLTHAKHWLTRLEGDDWAAAARFFGSPPPSYTISVVIREGLLPLLVFDAILLASNPPSDRTRPEASNEQIDALTEAQAICRADNRNQSLQGSHANCAEKKCLGVLAALGSSGAPGGVAQRNLTRVAFMIMAMLEVLSGHCVLTGENIVDVALKYCDPAITRTDVEGVISKPDTEGIAAALAVALTSSPIFLLRPIEYSMAEHNWSTFVFLVCQSFDSRAEDSPPQSRNSHRGDGNEVDHILWKLLFSAGVGKIEPDNILPILLDNVEVQRIMNGRDILCSDKMEKTSQIVEPPACDIDSDASSLLSSAPPTRSQTPVSQEPASVQPVTLPERTVGAVQDVVIDQRITDQSPESEVPTTSQEGLSPTLLRYLPVESPLMPFTRYRFQEVAEECEKLCNSLPPRKSLISRISRDDLYELRLVCSVTPEPTYCFPADLSPLLLRHREQLERMSSKLAFVVRDYHWPATNAIAVSSTYIRRVEQLLSQVS